MILVRHSMQTPKPDSNFNEKAAKRNPISRGRPSTLFNGFIEHGASVRPVRELVEEN
jgi:hypothetical protein